MDNFILLPTGKPAQPHDLVLRHLILGQWLERTLNQEDEVYANKPAQHLYQVREQNLLPTDWAIADFSITTDRVELKLVKGGGWKGIHYKIIASTNPDLNLPLIPKEGVEEFIKSYNQVPA